ncbi:hypothetical protein [Marichromatium bheemlicum]|uniref:Tetratricopeptide repeat protein n=1 Tax=Marichromatium bheemlicum TaxID=365339 RepID=A0ABX1I2V5_9GAMM|nr:hypothetical protein [Marichromatium bheemlicum]NKN31685.1 hypothetical protein [Marichromatium bheemlicum]
MTQPGRAFATLIAALSLLGLGGLARLEPPRPKSPAVSAATTAQTEQTRKALDALASGRLDDEAERVAAVPGLIPAGDTCGARRAQLMAPMPRVARARFAAASLAASPEVRLALLTELEAEYPAMAWRIRLEMSEVARRAGDRTRAGADAEAALALDPPAGCRSDAWFRKALVSDGAARLAALRAAVADDPGHYNAWAYLAVELMRLLDHAAEGAHCDAAAAQLVRAIVYLDRLARTDAQLARLERLANAASPAHGPGRALLLGMVQERTRRLAQAAATYGRVAAYAAGDCMAPVALVARTRLNALDQDTHR